MPNTRGRRTTPNCDHCGRRGHVSNLCPRDDYSGDIPALTQCVRRVISAANDSTFQMYCAIDPCILHSTLTAQPPSLTIPSALSTAMASLSAANQPNPSPAGPSQTTSSQQSSGPTTQPAVPPPQPVGAQPVVPVQNTTPARRNNRSYSFADMGRKYHTVTTLVNSGVSLLDALAAVNVKERTFRRWRLVAEARLVDESRFNLFLRRSPSPTLEDCVAYARTNLDRASSRVKLNSLFLTGAALKPMAKRN